MLIGDSFPAFKGSDGAPLTAGSIYFGVANSNPETSPITVYWDDAFTQPAAQPIRTLNGFIVRDGVIANLYVNVRYSITVKDSAGVLLYSMPDSLKFDQSSQISLNLAASSGSSLVGFIQAGTGAVARTAQDKMRELVNVKDFGAKGDGVTDDTAAIQAAIDYCTNLSNRKQTLFFPANDAGAVYKITSTLTISGRLSIVGDGAFSTTVLATGLSSGQSIFNFDNLAASVVYYGGVENITLRSDNSLAVGIRLNNISYVLVKNVQLYGLLKGVYITGTSCFSNFFEEVTCYLITSYSVEMDAFSGGGHYMFSGCTFTGSDGFYLSNTATTDGLSFYNCNFEQCVVTDIYITGSVNGLTISGCRSEGLDGANAFLISPDVGKIVAGISISGCTWTADSGNAYPITLSGSGTVQGFSITGNSTVNIGFLAFVNLNGAGDGGIIAGNYCKNTPIAAIVNTPRAGVSTFNNQNLAGAMYDYGGNYGSFTLTGTGFTTSPTSSCYFSQNGKTVTVDIGGLSGVSNATTFTMTGLPTQLKPAGDKDIIVRIADNSGSNVSGFARVKSTGVIEVYATLSGGAFTAAGTKSVAAASLTYTLN